MTGSTTECPESCSLSWTLYKKLSELEVFPTVIMFIYKKNILMISFSSITGGSVRNMPESTISLPGSCNMAAGEGRRYFHENSEVILFQYTLYSAATKASNFISSNIYQSVCDIFNSIKVAHVFDKISSLNLILWYYQ